MNYEERFQNMKDYYEIEKTKKDQLRLYIDDVSNSLSKITIECDNILIKKELLQKATEQAREKAKELIENVGTEALQMVLGEDKRIVIRLSQRDGVPAANLFVQTVFGEDDVLENNPSYGSGGVRDIISLATLTANRMLETKNNKAPMFLDEPFKNVSAEYAAKVAEFLNKLVEYFGGQFFVVTHERSYMPNSASKTFSVSLDSERVSNVIELK